MRESLDAIGYFMPFVAPRLICAAVKNGLQPTRLSDNKADASVVFRK